MEEAPVTEERIAKNDAVFRNANEGIGDTAREYEMTGWLPFICECANPDCTEIVQLTLEEYEAVRSEPTHFFNAVGHEVAAGPAGRVVAEHSRFVIVQKVGRAAEVVEDLDPRNDGRDDV